MSDYSREHPDEPELDAGAIEEAAESKAANLRSIPLAPAAEKRENNPPATLVDADGNRVDPNDAISETQVASLLGLKQNTLGTYRRGGKINPRLLLTNSSPVAPPPGRGHAVWWNRPLVEAIARSESTEPFYV